MGGGWLGYIHKQSQTGEFEANCQSLAASRCLNGFLHSARGPAISFQHGLKKKSHKNLNIKKVIWRAM